MKRILTTLLALGLFALVSPAASADVTVTPVVSATGRATDNAGQRPDGAGARSDVVSDLGAGGSIYWSRPTAAIKLEALGEYERYLSQAVRNTYAGGGLDGKWRPDERTTFRSLLKASYAPDRYDPRVPYRLVISSPDPGDLPTFIRATTTKVQEDVSADRWYSETWRGHAEAEISSTKYSDRKAIGATPTALDPRVLQSRTVASLGAAGFRQLTEPAAVGLYGNYGHADYEKGPTVHQLEGGAVTEWNASERVVFKAKLGLNAIVVPGPQGVPTRMGWNGDVSLARNWERGSFAASAKQGTFLTSGAIPASNRREGRLDAMFRPFERVETSAWVEGAREHSMYSAFAATGTYTIWTAGGALGLHATEHTLIKLGYEHDQLATHGLVALPYRQNVVFFGITFTGGPFGDPPTTP